MNAYRSGSSQGYRTGTSASQTRQTSGRKNETVNPMIQITPHRLGISDPGALELSDNYAKVIPDPDKVSPLLGVSVDEEYELIELSPPSLKVPTAVYMRDGIPIEKHLAPANCSSTINGHG